MEIAVTAPVLVDDAGRGARRRSRSSQSCPALGAAKLNVPYVELALADLYAGVHASYPDEHRYAVDNMWTSAPAADLTARPRADRRDTARRAVAHAVDELGPGLDARAAERDMAYSVEDDTYIALYAVWQDPAARRRQRGVGDGLDARDGAPGERHPARRREPRPAPGALRRRGADAPPRRAARAPRPRAAASTNGWGGERAPPRALPAPADEPARPGGAARDRRRAARPRRRRCALSELDRLLDPAELPGETGWCALEDGCGYVAVATRDAGRERRDGRLVVRLAPA